MTKKSIEMKMGCTIDDYYDNKLKEARQKDVWETERPNLLLNLNYDEIAFVIACYDVWKARKLSETVK